MLFLMVLLTFTTPSCSINLNGGSTVFYNRNPKSECWNEDDIAKLRARRSFEHLILPLLNPDKINSQFIRDTLRYYKRALNVIEKASDLQKARLLKEAFEDAVGAHFRSEFLPIVRFAYYAGNVPYRNARKLEDFFDAIKADLNTQGLGWKVPRRLPEWSNLTVSKILIGAGTIFNPCSSLVIKRDAKSCIHLPTPKLDDESSPSSIVLPFKTRGLVSLCSPYSENILLKYYTTASRCILRSSPKNCRHADFTNFNNEMWHWMKRDIAPHLIDEKLYSAYGGVLRIAATVQSYGKGISRRNLFDQNYGTKKWQPWRALTDSYVYVNNDWSPKFYVLAVILIAIAIYLLQFCFNYAFNDSNGKGHSRSHCKDVAYTSIESNIPVMIPHQSAVYYTEKQRVKRSASKIKTSLGSIHTQKVYDLNENTEKLMAVIMSDRETSSSESEREGSKINENTPKSPPRLDASMTQLKITRTPCGTRDRVAKNMYSTSALTQSEVTYQVTDSWSESSTSATSVSSTTSKTRTRRSKSSRDLAWARRVVSKQSLHNLQSTSMTELDVNSFTTPPSQR